MNLAHAIKSNTVETDQIRALKELDDFLESPRSIGLDNLKESLRNVVQIMLELSGYNTGMDLQHLVHGEHSSMAMDGVLVDDEKRKKKRREFFEYLAELDRLMHTEFKNMYDIVEAYIVKLTTDLHDEIEKIDAQIKKMASTPSEENAIKATHFKRNKLIAFKEHVVSKQADLQDSKTTEELVEIQHNLFEDTRDFIKNAFNRFKERPSIFSGLPERSVWAAPQATSLYSLYNDKPIPNIMNVVDTKTEDDTETGEQPSTPDL